MQKKIFQHPFLIRLFNWEYWSFNTVYAPIYLYWLWLVVKSRSFFFFNAANPLIKNGGFLMESKKEIYDLIPSQFCPPTLLFNASVAFTDVCKAIKQNNLNYPLIAKPDIGMRGLMVQKTDSEEELKKYIDTVKVDFLVQEFIPYQEEAGIFYCRIPNEEKGFISGIVGKDFVTVTGDGKSTIAALLQQEQRYILQLPILKITLGKTMEEVLEKGIVKELVPYGNHSRGSKFIDISKLADEKLTATFDEICKQIPDFYYGRMDIRYNTWEELKEGKNFSIIELNGAGSEPTHMYDPCHSIFFAWKEIIRHWEILYRISKINHRTKQIPYMTFSAGLQMLKENTAYVKIISGKN